MHMSLRLLDQVTPLLPTRIRAEMRSFGTFVDQAADELAASRGVRSLAEETRDQLVLAAGLWHLWQSVAGPLHTLQVTLTYMRAYGADSLIVEDREFGPRGSVLSELTVLRDQYAEVLSTSGLDYLKTARSLDDVVAGVLAGGQA